MPAGLFNFSRYIKKNPSSTTSGQSNKADDQKVVKEEVSTTTQVTNQPVTYSGIGNPSAGQAYNGIGNPPAGQAYNGIGNPPEPPVITKGPGQNPADKKTNIIPNSSQSSIDMGKRVGMDVLSRMTQRANTALMQSANKAKELKIQYIDTEHVLWGLLHDSGIYQLISECKAVPSEIQTALEKSFKLGNHNGVPQFSPRVKRVLELSLSAARGLGYEFISPEHILLALSHEGEGMAAQTLVKYNLTSEVLNQKITGKKKLEKEEKESEKTKTSSLEQYTEDLTAKAARGELDPVVGRSWEIERVIHILSRRTKNNPVLIGDAGVGKTAIVEGLALRIAHGDVAETLLNKRILLLDLMSLIAGASHRGEFEERLKNLIKEVKVAAGGIILFIDELHNMVGAGSGSEGTMDASNILKPSLARGELQMIGTTTITEYRKYVEKDPALERRFQPVYVSEPTAEVAIQMLTALRDRYEAFHRVKISDETIDSAVRLSQRYIGDRFLPDKAVDLIDEAAASVRLPAISLPEEIKNGDDKLKKLGTEKLEAEKIGDKVHADNLEKEIEELQQTQADLREQYLAKKSTTTNVVGPEIIAEIISRWTNIPISRLTESESTKLMDLENIIHKRLINQEDAVSAVSEAVRRGRAGLKSNKRPIGSFIFMGPTGVGKTELAKVLAETLFGSEEMIVRLDMTEYMEKHEVAKLIGAPPGYVGYEEGGQLTEAVRRHPYAVVLLDEIEKAHPDVFNILIQLLDDGRLTDNKGHTISFKNTIVICTSNLGSRIIQEEMLGWKDEKLKKLGTEEKEKEEVKKEEVFATYSVSPTGRELITYKNHLWEKDGNEKIWKTKPLSEYFAGSVIINTSVDKTSSPVPSSNDFPEGEVDTHLIAPDGAETITRDDQVWFRTSTTGKEWTKKTILELIKGQTVINALPDKPEEQLPTAVIDTHAISPENVEIISLGNRYWKRENLQTQNWTTGTLEEYFKNSKLKSQNSNPDEKNQEEKNKKAEARKEEKTETKIDDVKDTVNPDFKAQNLDDDKKSDTAAGDEKTKQEKPDTAKEESKTGEKEEEKPEEKTPEFPIQKWDIHLFKPTGEEIIIWENEYYIKPSALENIWKSGKLEDLIKETKVDSDKEENQLPLGREIKSKHQDISDEQFAHLANRLMDELREFFRPELLNRFDEVVIFRPLSREHMIQIVDLQVKNLSKLLSEQNIAIEVSDLAKAYLCEAGFDPIFGARPLRRTMQRLIENQISSLLIKGDLASGDTVIVDFDPENSELTFNVKKMEKKPIIGEQPVQTPAGENTDMPQEKNEQEQNIVNLVCEMCGHKWQVKIEEKKEGMICPQCSSTLVKEEVIPKPVEESIKPGESKDGEQTATPSQDGKNTEVNAVQSRDDKAKDQQTENPANPLEAYFQQTEQNQVIPPAEIPPVPPPVTNDNPQSSTLSAGTT